MTIQPEQCDALQFAGIGSPAPWYRDMIDSQAPGYESAGLTMRSVFLRREDNCVDALLPLIEASGCRLFVNRALAVAPSDIAALAALLPDVRFVTVCHSSQTFLWDERNGAARQELHLALARAMPNVAYATPHKGTAEVLGCHWWPNWVDPVDERAKRQPPEGRPWRISLVTNLRLLKAVGVQILGVHASGLDCELYLALTKPERPDLAMQVQATVNSCRGLRVRQVPWQRRAEYLAFIETMDLAMQCSPSESENLVALEHMLRGVPTLGSPALTYVPTCQTPRNPDCPRAIGKRLAYMTADYPGMSAMAMTAARHHTTRSRRQFTAVLQELLG